MAIIVQWYDVERKILLWAFPESFTVADFTQASKDSYARGEEVDYPHCLLFDLRRTKHLPPGALVHIQNAQRRAVATPKYLFTVSMGGSAGGNRLARMLIEALKRIGFAHYLTDYVYFVDDIDAALTLIREKMNLPAITPVETTDQQSLSS